MNDDKSCAQYGALAQIYDKVMSFLSYNSWFDLILKICSQNGLKKDAKILELGAGTGTLGKKLSESEFSYQGCDLSFEMAQIAKNKGLDFVCADCRNLPFNTKFDLLLFLFDGINYIFEAEGFTQTFEEAHRVLADGGLFLFDITTQTNSKTYFTNYREALSGEDFTYIRESYYDEKNCIQHNDFDIYLRQEDGNYGRFKEKHRQKVRKVEEIAAFIPKNLFDTVGIWGDFEQTLYNKKSERVHFLLRKK
ncbi:MAG: class I SAM-dependent methyltransferase [Chitinivibrionia bacterium]|nr:class I SAM-dependent methyltransferase [Chitinivibrionia bacterium]